MRFVYVVSYDNGSINNFTSNFEVSVGQNVIVNNEKGEHFGKVLQKNENKTKQDYHIISRIASKEDNNKFNKNLKDANQSLIYSKKLAEELKLKMNIVSSVYSFSRSQLLINFYADERVDFREYAKKLAYKYKTRIELRQIGARDRSKEISGYGICGQKLCCSRHLSEMESVSINMAKNQNLALNPTKINGVCNRLLCCLAYEDDIYTENRNELPQVGQRIKYEDNDYTVKSLDILKKEFIIYVDKERVRLTKK